MNEDLLLDLLTKIGRLVCQKVYSSLKEQSVQYLSSIHSEAPDDTIYQIDRDVEDLIIPEISALAEKLGGIMLVAEGISHNNMPPVFPVESQYDPGVLIIMDPIDGTRGIMYDKRPAFFLAAAAPYKKEGNRLQDIEIAVMTELAHSKSYLSDTLWALKGKGAFRKTLNLISKEEYTQPISPSKAQSIAGGFSQISRFFPPGRDIIAAIEEDMLRTIFPDFPDGKSILFEDQYISSGGQLYEMLVGHDRFVADIRTALFNKMRKDGKRTGHVCHPYDVCASLIGQEAGIIITDLYGNALNPPLDTQSPVDWVAYANQSIRSEVEEAFQKSLKKFGLIE